MRRFALSLAFVIAAVPPAKLRSSLVSTEGGDFQATIEITSQDYCLSPVYSLGGPGHSTLGHLSFKMNVTLRNVGQRPLILSRKYIEASEPTLFVVNSDGSSGKLADSMNEDRFGFDNHYPRNLRRGYVILQPDNSIEIPVVTSIRFTDSQRSFASGGAVSPGNYFLSVMVYDWHGPPEALKNLRDRWKKRGYLKGEGVWSNQVPVIISPPKSLSECKFDRDN